MEKAYQQIEARYEERDQTLQNDLKTYLEQYPYTTYKDEVYFFSGVLYAEKGKWKNAAKDSRVRREGTMVRILPAVETFGPKPDRIM